MTIGVICAIPQELSFLLGLMSGPGRQQIAQVTFDVGTLDDYPVVLAAAGMGKVNTSLVVALLADRFRCRAIVFTGVAGGLDAQLRIGDVVVVERVVQHDFGLVEDERLQPYQPGHISVAIPWLVIRASRDLAV